MALSGVGNRKLAFRNYWKGLAPWQKRLRLTNRKSQRLRNPSGEGWPTQWRRRSRTRTVPIQFEFYPYSVLLFTVLSFFVIFDLRRDGLIHESWFNSKILFQSWFAHLYCEVVWFWITSKLNWITNWVTQVLLSLFRLVLILFEKAFPVQSQHDTFTARDTEPLYFKLQQTRS